MDGKPLDQRIGRVKNAIRSLFANRGVKIPRGSKSWYSGRDQINSRRKLLAECETKELWRGEIDLELTQLDSLTAQLAQV